MRFSQRLIRLRRKSAFRLR